MPNAGLRLTLGVLFVTFLSDATAQPANQVVQTSFLGETSVTGAGGTLDRLIDLDLRAVSRREALLRIGTAGGVTIGIRVPSDRNLTEPVSLYARSLTVRAALNAILKGTGLGAELIGVRDIIISADSGRVLTDPDAFGMIRGSVRDRRTNEQLAGVVVRIRGTSSHATSGLDGRYQIGRVIGGDLRVEARRLGYAPATIAISLHPGDTATVDFLLSPSAYQLDQVVTTITGDAPLLQLGNSIGTIRADSVAATQPVTDLSDIINARVPGVQVILNGGLTGASPQINIRGQNSAQLSNQPLLYIDGARVDNSVSNGVGSGRSNDISPDEIESIEIVKGPSAATLYGTDAANGVIVVRTKRGASGRRLWSAYAESGTITLDRDRFPESYYPWGTTVGGAPAVGQCTLQTGVATGACTIDSVTRYSPLRNLATTPIGTGQRQAYGLQLSGGGSDMRYFLSGAFDDETGYLKLPTSDRDAFAAERGADGFSQDDLHPNGLQRASARENVTASLGRDADLTLSSSFLTQNSRIPNSQVIEFGVFGPGYQDSTGGWALGLRPAYYMLSRNDESVDHFTGSATSNWRPASWLTTRATAGLDFSLDYLNQLTRAGEGLPGATQGSRNSSKTSNTLNSIDLGATASFDLAQSFTSRTSVGAQYNRSTLLVTGAGATSLLPGGVDVFSGSTQSAAEETVETVVAGAYVEQTFALNERLFVTGAVRADGSGSFGSDFQTAYYPKGSLSWLISRESFWPAIPGLSNLRLRAAYGEAGIQPSPTARLAREGYVQSITDGSQQVGAILTNGANPNLKPEFQREFEGGFDAGFLGGRINVELTYYQKHSTDALSTVPLGPSIGGPFGFETINVGSVNNLGYEALVNVVVLKSRDLALDLTANGSINHNKLVRLESGVVAGLPATGAATNVAGYPVSSLFDYPITRFSDANHNGIIDPSEITLGSSPVFMGQTYPKTQLTVGGTVGLLNNHVRLNAQLDYRGGFVILNQAAEFGCLLGFCRATSVVGSDLRDQAAASAIFTGPGSAVGYYQDGSFTRLREVSVTFSIPDGIARRLRTRTLSVTLAGRNLALWTKYTGPDPEVSTAVGDHSFNDQGAVPPGTYWIARVNLGL